MESLLKVWSQDDMPRIVCLTMKSQKISPTGQSSPIRDAVAALSDTAPQITAFGAFFAEGHDTGEHHHDRAQFVHAERGLLQVWTEEGQWSVPPGTAVWVPARVPHRVRAISDADFVSLYIRAPRGGEPVIPVPSRCGVVTVSPLLKHLIVHLKELSAGSDGDRQNRLAAVIADELTELVSADLHLPIPSDRRAARVALAMIDDPSDDRDLAAWGRDVGASGRTLTRHFAAETGLSFSEWRQRCRLFAALEMLSAGKPVTAIALDAGYRSPSAFSAAFTKMFGISPRNYRIASHPDG
ncbi:AraC family transcriptional regulator [Nisaea nitritireducens]|uniref:AraC family transcriptional regulator n=1 Tax=Nisaea nitritireducens TaxID=568392 RepID=UPI001868B515|nr:helix-turn-helix transcriptional regulator [Nisaea nitritireducens]